jgi:signal transduction histidine kinase
MFRRCFLFFFICLYCPVTFAQSKQQTVVVGKGDHLIPLGKNSWHFEDKTGTMSVRDIQDPKIQSQFVKSQRDVFIGPASMSAVWFKLIIKNETDETLLLDAGGGLAGWYIDFYRPDSLGNYSSPVKTGSFRPEANKEFPVNMYWLKLAEESSTGASTYYIRYAGQQTKEFPLNAGTLSTLQRYQARFDVMNACFVGWLLSLILYNLFLGVSTKDKIYFIYLGYLIPSMINTCFLGGYEFSHNIWWKEYHYVWMNINFLFAFYFTREYLELSKTAPRLNKMVIFLTGLCFLFSVLNLFGVPLYILINYFQKLSGMAGILLLIPGIYLWSKGYRNGAIYTIGWSFLIISNLIYNLTMQGIMSSNAFTRNIFYYGIAIEVLVFSLALADRLNTMKREKQQAQAKNIDLIQRQNIILEQKVNERTEEIRKQAADLAQLNATKDKLFSIIGHDLRGPVGSLKDILNLASKQEISVEELREITPVLQRSASNLYETLDNLLQWSYSQMKGMSSVPKEINVTTVVMHNIELFGDYAATKEIKIELEDSIECSIFADENQVNIILRNLISNAIKFTASGGKITLKFIKKGTFIDIVVADTGVGMGSAQLDRLFKMNTDVRTYGTRGENGTGLGLLLCKEMVEINHGSITVDSEEGRGTEFSFKLPALV